MAGAFVLGILGAGPMALLFNWLIRREGAAKTPPAAPAWPDAGPERLPR
jgi:hypothetical protein